MIRLKKNIATSDSGFIFNPATGDSFSGNDMASYLLNAMKNGESEAQIKNEILENYDVNAARLDRDWEDWVIQLKEAGLIEC